MTGFAGISQTDMCMCVCVCMCMPNAMHVGALKCSDMPRIPRALDKDST